MTRSSRTSFGFVLVAASLMGCGAPHGFDAGGPFTVIENLPAGALVTTLTVPDSATLQLVSGNTGDAFQLDASNGRLTIQTPSAVDFEAHPTFNLQIHARFDSQTAPRDELVLEVLDANDAPVLLSSAFQMPEDAVDGTVVGTLQASDQDVGQSVTFAVTGGAAAGLFALDPSTGVLTVADAEALGTGPWVLEVTLTDSGVPPRQTVTTVTIGTCQALALGEVFAGPAAATFCLEGDALGAEYTVMPVNLADTTAAQLVTTVTGNVPVSGAPQPKRAPPQDGSARFEEGIRQLERAAIAGWRRPSEVLPPRASIVPGVPTVGSTMTINVATNDACTTVTNRTGEVMAVSTHAIVMDDQANPANGLTQTDYQEIAAEFDADIFPTITAAFGAPADIDTNGRVILFYTSAVNALTATGSSSFIAGFFFARDVLTSGCASGNRGEMFYMMAADPLGSVNGNVRSVDSVKQQTLSTVAHEFQHLINASRRIHVNNASVLEEVWLDEGLSHIAEELMFYSASGRSPRSNIELTDLFDLSLQAEFLRYAEANFARLRSWLLEPQDSGSFRLADSLGMRGASWAFLRYAADRRGGTEATLWFALANATNAGMNNVDAALGVDARTWVSDFVAAMYADDTVPGVASAYTQPSWNFRSIFAGLDYAPGPDVYPLTPRDPAAGVADSVALSAGGGAAFIRVGVAPQTRATITMSVGGGAPPSTVRLVIFRRR